MKLVTFILKPEVTFLWNRDKISFVPSKQNLTSVLCVCGEGGGGVIAET